VDWRELLIAVLVLVAAFPLLRLWTWCLSDLFGDAALDTASRGTWALALLVLNLPASLAYVAIGPGRDRWDPRILWWPWIR
jgi:hypothetical protein